MTLQWLGEGQRVVCGTDAGTYAGGPFRIVLHRTEGSSIAGAVNAYIADHTAPHLTVDLRRRQIAQHTPFDKAARSLQNLPGGVETNKWSCIQIEIVGFSARSGEDSDADVVWFGEHVLAPIMHAYGIHPVAPVFHGEGCGWTLASAKAKQRMSNAAWNAFSGVCAHQHVPEQSHWDAGNFKIDVALQAAFPDRSSTSLSAEDDDMTPEDRALLNAVNGKLDTVLGQLGYDVAKNKWGIFPVQDGTTGPDGQPRKLTLFDLARETHGVVHHVK